jgi:uncharacterized membrane protein YgcG
MGYSLLAKLLLISSLFVLQDAADVATEESLLPIQEAVIDTQILNIPENKSIPLPSVQVPHRQLRAWLPNEFPNPDDNPQICRTLQKRLCDPDAILQVSEIQTIEDYLRRDRHVEMLCSEFDQETNEKKESEDQQSKFEDVQIGVALVERMNLRNFHYDPELKGAEKFGRHVHDAWGVGKQTVCGGTGVLIFLSTLDRAVYISRGKALEPFLTKGRIEYVISSMRSSLQEQNYGQAIIQALEKIDYILTHEKPVFTNDNDDVTSAYWTAGLFFGFFGLATFLSRRADRYRRQYANVASNLNAIDEQRAQALQGQFQAKSCPICLEDFQSVAMPPKGSDGLPLKLLRCGHVFDETCWINWVNSGHGHYNKCPICREDVTTTQDPGTRPEHDRRGLGLSSPTNDSSPEDRPQNPSSQSSPRTLIRPEDPPTFRSQQQQQQRRRQPPGPRDFSTWRSNRDDTSCCQNPQERTMHLYRLERNFRLERLARRYPDFLRPQQLRQWTSPTFDGPLANDPEFVRLNPRSSSTGSTYDNNNGSSGFSSSGFGGASSSGGGGGRW